MKKRLGIVIVLATALAVFGGCSNVSGSLEQSSSVSEADENESAEAVESSESNEDASEGEEIAGSSEETESSETEAEASEENTDDVSLGEGVSSSVPYTLDVVWNELDTNADSYEENLVIEVSDGTSTVDYSSQRVEEADGKYNCYYKLNGVEELVYSKENVGRGWRAEFYRDDVKYNFSWETSMNDVDTDCSAIIYKNGEMIDKASRDERMFRSYTGAWFFGIGSINNGEYGEYDASWIEGQ